MWKEENVQIHQNPTIRLRAVVDQCKVSNYCVLLGVTAFDACIDNRIKRDDGVGTGNNREGGRTSARHQSWPKFAVASKRAGPRQG